MGELSNTPSEDSKKLEEEYKRVTELENSPLQFNDTWFVFIVFLQCWYKQEIPQLYTKYHKFIAPIPISHFLFSYFGLIIL